MIAELARQLDSWRALLPDEIRWHDNNRFAYVDSGTFPKHSVEPLFSSDEGIPSTSCKNDLDVLTAELRTRFYYARHMLYRPFVHKALHCPGLMSADDINCCVLAIQAACLWPVFMAPHKYRKRIVPHLFTWTNSSIGILLILRMTRANEGLRGICEERVSGQEIDRTVVLILDWLKDIKQIDATAQWAWSIFEPMFEAADVSSVHVGKALSLSHA